MNVMFRINCFVIVVLVVVFVVLFLYWSLLLLITVCNIFVCKLFLNDILHMSFLAGIHVFKAFPAYTTTEL